MSKNPSFRSGDGGFRAIRDHSYFDGFSWKGLTNETMDSPYIPKKFRTGHLENHNKTESQNFLRFLYKVNPKVTKGFNPKV